MNLLSNVSLDGLDILCTPALGSKALLGAEQQPTDVEGGSQPSRQRLLLLPRLKGSHIRSVVSSCVLIKCVYENP
jgi:hypothetical protein